MTRARQSHASLPPVHAKGSEIGGGKAFSDLNTDILLSVIICTHNRAGYLYPCVKSVLRQAVSRARYEVLIVENACTDETERIARELSAKEGVRHVVEPALGLSHARNRGWREARGQIVAFLDDDATAEPGWMESALSVFQEHRPQPAWVGGPIDLACEAPMPSWLGRDSWPLFGYLDWGDIPCVLAPGRYLGGGNSFFRREVLEQMGGFDARLGRQGRLLIAGEETHLDWRLRHAGEQLYYHPGVRIWHHISAERFKRSWVYRHAYWNGVTGSIMQRLLKTKVDPSIDIHAHSPTPQAGGRLYRVWHHATRSLGWRASKPERVASRIYLSYAIGAVAGHFLRHRIMHEIPATSSRPICL